MQTLPASFHPVVRAVVALDAFGAMSRADAANLLECWARRFQLSDSEVQAVLAHFPDTDPAGFHYSRDLDEVTGVPVPPGVAGTALRRADR
jgi:hypothetical protein